MFIIESKLSLLLRNAVSFHTICLRNAVVLTNIQAIIRLVVRREHEHELQKAKRNKRLLLFFRPAALVIAI